MASTILSVASPKVRDIGATARIFELGSGSVLYDPNNQAIVIASDPNGRGDRADITLPELVAIHQTCKGKKEPTICTIIKQVGEFDGFTLLFCGFEIDIYDDLEDIETTIAELQRLGAGV